MSQFSTYADYQKKVAEREAAKAAKGTTSGNFQKIGFFKLPNSGDVAFVRINYKSTDDFMFGSYHQLGAEAKYMKVLCLHNQGSSCPLCEAVEAGAKDISKARDRIFVPMLVAYRKPDGSVAPAEPVIWDASAAGKTDYAKDIAGKLADFGDLTKHVFKITRNGLSLDTTYSIEYVPTYDREDLVPADFSAFNNFRIDKHSYWVKTVDEINTFLQTGAFPAVVKESVATPITSIPTPVNPAPQPQPTNVAYNTATDPLAAAEANPYGNPTPVSNPYVAPAQPAAPAQETPTAGTPKPTTFSNFSF